MSNLILGVCIGTVIVMPVLLYGVLNIATPRTTVRWQMNATAKRREGDPIRALGTGFQRWSGMAASSDPLNDPSVLRRLRIVGGAEVAFAVLIVALVAEASRL